MLKNDEEEFFSYTRMSPKIFKYLLALLHMHKHPSRKNALTPQFRLVLTLQYDMNFACEIQLHYFLCCSYLAEGMTMREIARNFVIGRSTVHNVVKETCEVIWNVLMPIYLPPPTKPRFENIEREFWKRWNIPNCIGAVDGKHILIQAPAHSGTDYFSYKKTFRYTLGNVFLTPLYLLFLF